MGNTQHGTMSSISRAGRICALILAAGAGSTAALAGDLGPDGDFRRISTIPVFLNTDVALETVAEIVTVSEDGMTLIYTDSETENIGFIDITDPANPIADGLVATGAEPTSVAVAGGFALACVNTSADFVNTSGDLLVIDIAARNIVRTIPLGGQPDAIAVSPDRQYAAIAIENERDEDLGNGEPPQLPPGFVVIVDLVGPPANWMTRTVDLVNVPTLFPEDPEPEFVDINANNEAVVTLQENNHIVIIDLPTGAITNDFSAGTVSLDFIDILENDLIEQVDSLMDIPREPDAVGWISNDAFATADEGDLFGGSRGFTIFSTTGSTLFEADNTVEHLVARHGHYPEGRSENKGNEPEGIEFGVFSDIEGIDSETSYLFVGSERSNLIAVYEIIDLGLEGLIVNFLQVLPATVGPEGLLAIPSRDLFVVAAEVDDRGDKIRSTVSIYQRNLEPNYPTIVSADRDASGVPIPWAALSGLVTHPNDDQTAYTVYDSFYQQSRFFEMDLSAVPAVITSETALNDSGNVLLTALNTLKSNLPGTDDFDPMSLVNMDGTINVDPEGVTALTDGTLWIASEGAGNLDDGVSDPMDRPFESPNMLLNVSAGGDILNAVFPPLEVTMNQLRFGFEGVAIDEANGYLYVAFQRAWQNAGDPSDRARIARYDIAMDAWTFAFYPLDTPISPNGGWVGLSEVTLDPAGRLIVLERDNQGGPDAAVKRIYAINPASVTFMPNSMMPASDFDVFSKTLLRDLLAQGDFDSTGGLVPEKLEGLAINSAGDVYVVNDNDGVDDNSGETQLLKLEGLADPCFADLNGDLEINMDDLSDLLSQWDTDGQADFNGDGVVDGLDLAALLATWGTCATPD